VHVEGWKSVAQEEPHSPVFLTVAVAADYQHFAKVVYEHLGRRPGFLTAH